MMDNETEYKKRMQEIKKSVAPSWLALIMRFIGAFILYAILHHYFLPVENYGGYSPSEHFVFVVTLYFGMFSVYLVVCLLIALIVAKLPKNRENPVTSYLDSGLVAALIISILVMYLQPSNGSTVTKGQASSGGDESVYSDIHVSLGKGDSEGANESHFTTEWLNGMVLESKYWWVRHVKNQPELRTKNPNFSVKDILSESKYTRINNKKVAVINLSFDTLKVVYIHGFNTGKYSVITCMRGSGPDISTSSGKCANKIIEVFGAAIP